MKDDQLQKLRDAIRDIADFPQPGIIFKDITPVLASHELLTLVIDGLAAYGADKGVTKVAGIDARGFIFGSAVAQRLGAGFVPVRKKGKLPWKCEGVSYDLEYGSNEIELHQDAIEPGERVLLVDDLLATGGTAAAAIELIQRLRGDLVAAAFFIELDFLKGRDVIAASRANGGTKPVPIEALLNY